MDDKRICNDLRPCFARGLGGICEVLESTYEPGKCPFCKPLRSVTKGKHYPTNENFWKISRSRRKHERNN